MIAPIFEALYLLKLWPIFSAPLSYESKLKSIFDRFETCTYLGLNAQPKIQILSGPKGCGAVQTSIPEPWWQKQQIGPNMR